MKIDTATQQYERWLATHTPLVKADLKLKHALMKQDLFSFLRATFYRWAQVFPIVCPELLYGPKVVAVGDLHIENFGTWRDTEGRLVWGINDFDEAYPFPYTMDLVRLAASVRVAIEGDHFRGKHADAEAAILEGYRDALESGGRPYVLAERHAWLRDIATNKLRDPVLFWKKLQACPPVTATVPRTLLTALDSLMPARKISYRLHRRTSGLGSLGRWRVVALAEWGGGLVAREAKAMAPSACTWMRDGGTNAAIYYQSVLDHAVRCPDPFVHVRGPWLVRRLAPYCSRIALSALPVKRDEARLLYAMGWETANVHLGTASARKAIWKDLAKRPARWLRTSAQAMVKATVADWKDWRSAG